MYKNHKVCVTIPAYNEEKLIISTLSGIPDYVDRIYVIDDCSSDRTDEIIKKHSEIYPRVIPIHHKKNKGVGGSIISGFNKGLEENYDIFIVMAGDNQMDPSNLPALINPIIMEEVEFTKGNRLIKEYWKGMSLFRLIGNLILSFLNKIASGYWNVSDPQNGFIAISREALLKLDINKLYNRYAFENDMMIKANIQNISMKNVSIPAKYENEESKINYGNFIFTASWFLLKSFFYRIIKKYLMNLHPLGFSIFLSITGIFSGIILLFFQNYWLLPVSFVLLIISFYLESLLNRRQVRKRYNKSRLLNKDKKKNY